MRQLLLQWNPSFSPVQPRAQQIARDSERIGSSNRRVSFYTKKPCHHRALTSARAQQLGLRSRALFEAKRVNLYERQKFSNSLKLCPSATDSNQQTPPSSICHSLFLSYGGNTCRKPSLCRRRRFVCEKFERGKSFVVKGRIKNFRLGYLRYQFCQKRFPSRQSIFPLDQGGATKFNGKAKADEESVASAGTHILSSSQQLNYFLQGHHTYRNLHVRSRSQYLGNFTCKSVQRSLLKSAFLKRSQATALVLPQLGYIRSSLDFRVSASERCLCVSFGLIEATCTTQFLDSRKFRVNAEGGKPKRSWWKRFLFEEIDSTSLLDWDVNTAERYVPGDDLDAADRDNNGALWSADVDDETDREEKDDIDRMLEDNASFEAWKRRVDARAELRDYKKLGRDRDNTDWEDWLDDSYGDYSSYVGGKDSGWYTSQSDWEKGGLPRSPPGIPERGMSRTMKEMLFRIFERDEEVLDDLAFEDRIFRFTSQATAKFVAVLIFVPWLVAFFSHDYVIVPFLNRYVETVPLAAEILDLRESQKLKMIETLKLERQRVRFEAAIGKAPPLSNDELFEHIRHEALELRDELRLENRRAFANIWSDLLAGATVFLLLLFNPKSVALMRLTGNRLFTNISDTGKAFIIILLTDIFLGYHSESGWETIVEMFLDHYGFEVDQGSIYIFVAIVPVTIDACFKLWVFRFFTRLSPSAAATFREMKRH